MRAYHLLFPFVLSGTEVRLGRGIRGGDDDSNGSQLSGSLRYADHGGALPAAEQWHGSASLLQFEPAVNWGGGGHDAYCWRQHDDESGEDDCVEGTHYSLSTVTEEGSRSVDMTGEQMLVDIHAHVVSCTCACMYAQVNACNCHSAFISTHFWWVQRYGPAALLSACVLSLPPALCFAPRVRIAARTLSPR